MSNNHGVDLDALEKEWQTNPEKWPLETFALIQRLRESEAALKVVNDSYDACFETTVKDAQRIAALERVLEQIGEHSSDPFTRTIAKGALAAVSK